MNTKRTARAVVYAARMAHLIDQYGHTWANIEATTKAILEGHPVPPDNVTVVDTMGNTYTGPLVEPVSPGSVEERVALELVEKYHRTKQCLVNVRQQRNALNADVAMVKRELATALDDLKGSELCRDQLRRDLETTDARCTELGAALVNARAAAEQLRKDNAAMRGTRDPALQAELELTQRARDTWRDTAMNTARERDATMARNKELEERNVELRQQLENLGNELARTVRDRDGFRRGAQFWMDSSKDRQAERDKAEAKVVKLRSFLESFMRYPAGGGEITRLLEETK